jgi:hypothetical protein
MVIVIAAVIIQFPIFIVMIIIVIIIVIIITTARIIEFGTEDLAEGKQCCNTNNNRNKPQTCGRAHKADSCL